MSHVKKKNYAWKKFGKTYAMRMSNFPIRVDVGITARFFYHGPHTVHELKALPRCFKLNSFFNFFLT